MKTMQKLTKIIRVKEADVDACLAAGYVFISKSEWKNSKVSQVKPVSTKTKKRIRRNRNEN